MTENNCAPCEFEKKLAVVRAFLRGRKFYTALRALEFARPYHSGTRRDGSPEFLHQVKLMLYHMSVVDSLMFPEEVFATDALHDLCEDYDVDIELIRHKFGNPIADAVWHMTKEYRGVKKSPEAYWTCSRRPHATSLSRRLRTITSVTSSRR